jgi:hypothetical protein
LTYFYKPKTRGIYFVKYGDYVGAFIIYIREHSLKDNYAFLITPNPLSIHYIPRQVFHDDLKEKRIAFVERLPAYVYNVCKLNFEYLKKKQQIG